MEVVRIVTLLVVFARSPAPIMFFNERRRLDNLRV